VKIKVPGNIENLQSMVMRTGIAGEWCCPSENHYQYRTNAGAILNWWESTGTVTFQGPGAAAANLKAAFVREADIDTHPIT
jgi:hypothetical protein